MPFAIVALVAAAASYGAAAAAAVAFGIAASSFAAVAIGAVVGAVVSYGLSAVLGLNKAPKTTAQAASDNKQMVRGSIEARRVIYGQARVSGPLVYAFSFGADKEMLGLVICLASHSVEAIDTVWIGDTAVLPSDIPAGPAGGHVLSGDLANIAWVYKHYGAADQAANAQLILDSPDGWDANYRLRGIAYLYVRLKYDRDKFQGIPNITALVSGKNDIYDPRDGSTGYTTNWALCVRDYLTASYGMACAADEIDDAYFIAAANLSDEEVDLDDLGANTQPRYVCNGTFTLDETPIDIVDNLLAAGAGALTYVQGKYRLYGGAYDSPGVTLTSSDFAGPIELQTLPPRAQMFNGVKGTFISPAKFWQATEFPAMQDPEAAGADGEEIWKEVDFRFVIDPTHAQRLARQIVKRSRAPLILKAPLRYSSLRLAVWDAVALTVPEFGWSAKPFRITSWEMSPAEGTINAVFQEEQVAAYAWLYDEAINVPDVPDTTFISPLDIPIPTGLTVTATTAVQGDGTVVPALLVTWTAAPHAFVHAYEVQWRESGTEEWNSREVAAPTTRLVIQPVITGVGYDVRVRSVANLVRSPFTGTSNGTGAADTTPPGNPTDLNAAGLFRGISITWTLPTDLDVQAVEVYENTTADAGTRYYVGESFGTGFLRTGLPFGATRYYWVRARDRSGNRSAFVGPVDAASQQVQTADFAAGIQPVTVVASLPPGYVTDFVVNTTDRKTYRWDGTAYVKAVDMSDLEGTLSEDQIGAQTISASKLRILGGSILADAQFEDEAFWTVDGSGVDGWYYETALSTTLTEYLGVRKAVILAATAYGGAARRHVASVQFGAPSPGQVLRWRARAHNGGNQPVYADLQVLDAGGGVLTGAQLAWPAGTDRVAKEVQLTVPAIAARYFKVVVYQQGGTDWAGEAAVSDMQLVPAATAEMIVDGAIRARHILAEEVFADAGVFNELTAGIASFGGLSAAQLRVDSAIITTSLQIGDALVNVSKLQSGAASGNASIAYNTTLTEITPSGTSGYSSGVLGSVSIAVGGDGRVVIHSKPPKWTTSSPGSGGGDGGGV